MSRWLIVTALLLLFLPSPAVRGGEPMKLQLRKRISDESREHQELTYFEMWAPGQTAIIVCDMWDAHHCLNAVRREAELAPRMNQLLENARGRGILIIHAPSSCMEPYKDHPGRKLAQSAPAAANLPAQIAEWCRHIPAEDRGKYPIDQSDGGEDDDLGEHHRWHEILAARGRNPKAPWKSQIDILKIENGDAISDSGVEIWNLLESRGIKNVILLGVHTNMCVLGRPFGLRQLAKNGKNVVLMRDMTDTMYNPARAPYVNHFTGTELIIQHIEKFVCPTITSVDFLGGEPFRFSQDRRRITMLIGEDEYQTEKTLPNFAKQELAPLGFDVAVIHSDPQNPHDFPGAVEATQQADLLIISIRRRLPSPPQLAAIRAHLAAGKPLLGIRTASHAFCLRDAGEQARLVKTGRGAWPEFDAEVLGGHYTNHHPDGLKTLIQTSDGAQEHPILRSVETSALQGNGSLYLVRPLAASTTPLLIGAIEGQTPEPVAWTNLAGEKKSRIFYTSLGHPADFANPQFRKLLVGGVFWTLEPDYKSSDRLLSAAAQ